LDQIATQHGSASRAGQLDAALRFARDAHQGQLRKQDGRPFIEHPIAVEELLAERGFNGTLLVAAYLHDTVEKTDVELTEIDRLFGPDVAQIVEALSEDASIEAYAERKRRLRADALAAGRASAIVYAADRLCNLRDWRALNEEGRRGAAERLQTTLEERVRLWGEDVEALTELDRELPFLEEVEVELRALRGEL
jgi:guanosine-3',5'-bis(diphosphate) 3'-pyrophosphohydrolase